MNSTTRTRQITPEVLNVLAGATCLGNQLRLVGQLDRKLYESTNEVLEAFGGKWNKKAKAHIFEGDAADLVDEAVLTGTFSKTKQDFGFFETYGSTLNSLLERAELVDGLAILEPSAGRGAIALGILDRCRPGVMACYELQHQNIDKLDMRICNATSEWADRARFPVIEGDFLAQRAPVLFERVCMNPPFAKRADIHHIQHAFGWLKPGGILVAIASASVKFRDDALARTFRNLVARSDGEIEDLPAGAFKESGTMVNTVLVTMRKN